MGIKKLQWEQSSPVSWQLKGDLGTHIYATIVEHSDANQTANAPDQPLFSLVFRHSGQREHDSGVYGTLELAQQAAQEAFEEFVKLFFDGTAEPSAS